MRAHRRRGVSLVEVMISMLVISLMAGALVRSVMMARGLTHASSQHVSAFGLCQAKLEEIRSHDPMFQVISTSPRSAVPRFMSANVPP